MEYYSEKFRSNLLAFASVGGASAAVKNMRSMSWSNLNTFKYAHLVLQEQSVLA